MLSFATCTEEHVTLAKSLTNQEIEELIEQIRRRERPQGDYWGLMYVRDLWALGIEPKVAPSKIVASFGQAFAELSQDWESRKSGEHIPYFGTAAEIEEYKAAQQNKKADLPPHESTTKSESRPPES
jgi:hypothetical protein